MIYGIGCDIAKISRFERWVADPAILRRFFHERELLTVPSATFHRQCEYYAVRFAAKESFAKALGTGVKGFELTDIYIIKDGEDRPLLQVEGRALDVLHARCGPQARVHVSLSHEKEYAIAYVAIEVG